MKSTSTCWVLIWGILYEMEFEWNYAMDSRTAAQACTSRQPGFLAVGTGIVHLHSQVPHFGQSTHQNFNANGQDWGKSQHKATSMFSYVLGQNL
jgi:hypothetical protein